MREKRGESYITEGLGECVGDIIPMGSDSTATKSKQHREKFGNSFDYRFATDWHKSRDPHTRRKGGGKDGRRVGLWVRVKARNLWVWIFRVAGKHGTAPGTVE